MNVKEHVSLKKLNTFGFDVDADVFIRCASTNELLDALAYADANSLAILPLGGGSNVVLTSDIAQLVLHVDLKGIAVREEGDTVYVTAQAGEPWHEFVMWTLDNGYYGLENLSLIPGNVGAAPIQNIGAYGVEIKDRFHSLKAINRQTREVSCFDLADCQFSYRDSVFKGVSKDQFLITEVTFALSKTPNLVLDYGGLADYFSDAECVTPKSVSDRVIAIRQSKLPDPNVLGNAGSFFKNPVISLEHAEALKARYPEIVTYPAGDNVKVAAGWLIDHCGFKGDRFKGVGVHQNQALVLVNIDNGTGKDIIELASKIQSVIKSTFNIDLEIEPRVY